MQALRREEDLLVSDMDGYYSALLRLKPQLDNAAIAVAHMERQVGRRLRCMLDKLIK